MKKIVINLSDNIGKIEIEGEGFCRFQSNLKIEDEFGECSEFNAAVDGMESLILAHACAGIDVTAPKYVDGIETAYLAICQNLL